MRALHKREEAFTLIEAAVAMVVATIIFVLLGGALGASLNASREARIQQEATSLANQYAELARSVAWSELAMDAVETGDPRVSGGQLLASAAETPANETLFVDSLGLIDARFTETIDTTDFTVWQYVTSITPDLRRVVVFVDWEGRRTARSHHVSVVVSGSREL